MTITMDETFTIDDLTALSEANPLLRYELSPEGTVEATMTPRSRHNWIVAELMYWLWEHIPDARGRTLPDTGLRVRSGTAIGLRRPDLVLFTQQPPDELYLDPELAILVVEVVSPATRRIDFEEKVREYAASGIPHYWIVDSAENVRLYRRDPNADVYHEYDAQTVALTELLARRAQEFLG